MLVIEGVILILIGLFAGAYGIMVGAGGGFIFVPALLIILDMPPALAAGTGLVVVLINATSGVAGFVKQKRIDYQIALLITLGALPGSFAGIWFSHIVSADIFQWIFAGVLILLGLFLQYKNRGKQDKGVEEPSKDLSMTTKRKISLIMVGIMMGIVSTFFGIGGGWLMVPILIYIYGIKAHRATATSVFALCLYSIIGVILHIYHGNVDWSAALWGGIGVLVGAQIGVYLSSKISGKIIVQMLSILLIVIGIKMIF